VELEVAAPEMDTKHLHARPLSQAAASASAESMAWAVAEADLVAPRPTTQQRPLVHKAVMAVMVL